MYLWRVSIAIVLGGVVWYFADCGRTVTQYLICFLCCLSTPQLFRNIGRENSTQTDEVYKETTLQGNCVEEQLCGYVVPDGESRSTLAEIPVESQYPHVKRSLQQVFECVYAQLVLPWYRVPEPCENQPLHQVLNREFDFIVEQLIKRAKDFDICEAVVGSIRILTQHLHNAKHPDRLPLFSCRAEEIAVLREFSEALVRNLFPQSLWGQDVNRCALNEIVALKGLELLVSWLSDPDNLNQLVVSQLDSVTPKSSVEELCRSDSEGASLVSGEGSEVVSSNFEGTENDFSRRMKSKKKGRRGAVQISRGHYENTQSANKLKEGWSKFVDKMKSKKAKRKKMKKLELEFLFRAMAMQGDLSNGDDTSSREGSIHSLQDSDGEDSDLENYLTSVQEDMMEFKLSYEMWRVGHWAVSIPHVDWEGDELIFTIHLEEKENSENLQWDIRKTHMDVVYFRNRWQDSTSLPLLSVLEEICNSDMSDVSDEVKEEARVSVECFLQELVSDDLIGHTQPIFQFLCPLDKLMNEEEHYGGVWGLLSGLAYFLTPGQEEEEHYSHHMEAAREDIISPHPETAIAAAENSDSSSEKRANGISAPIPNITLSHCDPPSDPCEEEEGAEKESQSSESSSQDKPEESDNPLTSHLKMIIKGLSRSRSQESLASARASNDEEQTEADYTQQSRQNGGSLEDNTDGPSWRHSSGRSGRKERICFKMSGGLNKTKGKDQGTLPKGEELQCQKTQARWEQQEATKAIFDLLKEISGNSILLNIFDAILKPVMPILKKKVAAFLSKMNPTEVQMASYIDHLREKQWPEGSPTAPQPPRTNEEKKETRKRAHHLINARYSSYLILKKTDMETVFNLIQDSEENKKLAYMLLSFLLREFLPNEESLNVSVTALQKVNNYTN